MTQTTEHSPNILSDLPISLPEELVQALSKPARPHRTNHIPRSRLAQGFWYDQDQHEWVCVLKGAARFGCDAFFPRNDEGQHQEKPLCHQPGWQIVVQKYNWPSGMT